MKVNKQKAKTRKRLGMNYFLPNSGNSKPICFYFNATIELPELKPRTIKQNKRIAKKPKPRLAVGICDVLPSFYIIFTTEVFFSLNRPLRKQLELIG